MQLVETTLLPFQVLLNIVTRENWKNICICFTNIDTTIHPYQFASISSFMIELHHRYGHSFEHTFCVPKGGVPNISEYICTNNKRKVQMKFMYDEQKQNDKIDNYYREVQVLSTKLTNTTNRLKYMEIQYALQKQLLSSLSFDGLLREEFNNYLVEAEKEYFEYNKQAQHI